MRFVITLNGKGGELDSRVVYREEAIKEAVAALVDECELAPGDSITISDDADE